MSALHYEALSPTPHATKKEKRKRNSKKLGALPETTQLLSDFSITLKWRYLPVMLSSVCD
jgi:hypothetical protein